MRRRLLGLAAVAAVAAAGLAVVPPANAATAERPELLEPTGQHRVGRTDLHLVDEGRADPWMPDQDRELMVSLYYPARKNSGKPTEYMTYDESKGYLEQEELDLPPETLNTVKTYAYQDAKPLPGKKRPLVLLSPGWTKPRATLTGIAEELASKGYIVAVMGHNYESVTQFPDGTLTKCEACGRNELDKASQGRAKDASFVIDELTDRRGPWRGSQWIDADRIAMSGHSLGGGASYEALRDEKRIKAVASLDSRIYEPGAFAVDRPLLLLGSAKRTSEHPDDPWHQAWDNASGWKRWISVDGTAHSSFTDVGLLGPQVGVTDPEQTLEPERCTELTRDVVSAFFDKHLKGKNRPILDGPTDDYPELKFRNP
ncbi:alpha/beta hydrolase family protein [Stackebrandtia nassauensis]|uniref:Platelet-activating factor acetylhydrolase plasma/intracellular isoform II n=1 Tax=Stackebrandtia nassauensis (strain DSM 44728 / CIP 108903 / NRRL B-16338 / NBRC 102104 / LLR-40K-21) TaxID=446470 RepID=D3QAN8_STANL|nr:alpha/beta hydrolase [Stackebrandtia nassauensis]ADD44684.1 Platelet-activating factor acetylhydrolase plasma/intracellular isoform II [Stackebrandtia nassauensis DSM 44728]